MGPQFGVALGAVGLVAFIVFIGVVAAGQRKKIAAAIKAVADAHGLLFSDNGLVRVVEGAKAGRAVSLRVEPSDPRRVQSVLAQNWKISLLQAPPPGLAATRHAWNSRPSDGTSRVETGDAAFDKAVFVESSGPGAEAWLTATRKAALQKLVAEGGLLYGGQVLFRKVGLETKPEVMLGRFEALWGVAEQLDAG